MHKKLIIDAFKKTKVLEEKKGIKKPSKSHIANTISDYFENEIRVVLGSRSLINYYNEAIALTHENEDIKIAQGDVINGLCKYLGYEDYQHFNEDIKKIEIAPNNIVVTQKIKPITKNVLKSNKIALLGAFILLIISIIFISYTLKDTTRWMVWNNDHYQEVEFNIEKYNINQLKIYNEERIKHFKKVTATCSTSFFSKKKITKIWYGKNENKKYEYFSALGLHPETGKTLKPITKYIINKYVCNEY
ncbi:hypothetical protein [Lacinutrix undariae]